MNAQDAFPSKYLKAVDLRGRAVDVTIEDVQLEEINKEKKLVMYFKGKDKMLVLNKTKVNTLSSLLNSDDTDDWIGHAITLEPGKTQYQGKVVDCINVALDLPAQPAARRAPQPVPTEQAEEIPF